MRSYYDNDIVREIESRLDIVDVVSETVNLTRKGNRYWGLCPFHQEKTPSFCVTAEKNMYYCFGCHAGGDMFSFVMKRDGMSFKEALELLAAKAGVQLVTAGSKKDSDRRKRLIEVNNKAAEFYHRMLMRAESGLAKEYLMNRGITEETMKKFGLGYAPDEWSSLQNYLLQKGYSVDDLKDVGLIKRTEKYNKYYDLLRNRIIFPIFQYNGDIIGFGGRVLDDSLPKYLNSPETEFFAKRKNLYGLFQARDAIRALNEVILVEGYMDCIKLHQAGIKNTVASLGTAFTKEQGQILRRYAEKVLILYDGDEAGQRETLKAINVLSEQQLRINVVSLPAGKDPDEYIDLFGKEDFLDYIKNNNISYIEFEINRYINQEKTLYLEDKIRIVNSLKNSILQLSSELEKDYYIKLLAQKLKLEENVVYREFRQVNRKNETIKRNKTRTIRDNIQYGNYSIEDKIMANMLKNYKIFMRIKTSIGLEAFSNPDYIKLSQLYDELSREDDYGSDRLGKIVQEYNLESTYAKLMLVIDEDIDVKELEIEEFIRRVKLSQWEDRWQRIYRSLTRLNDEGDFNQMLSFLLDLDSFLIKAEEGGIK